MDRRCIFKTADGRQCPKSVETGLYCAEHDPAKASEKPTASTETSKPSGGGGGGGGGGGWSIMGRTGVVYQKED